MNRRDFLKKTGLACAALSRLPFARAESPTTTPNILWIYIEDTCPWMSFYGDSLAQSENITPVMQGLVDNGAVLFNKAYVPAPVCSATRSAIITGSTQTTYDLQNHRSGRYANDRHYLPGDIKTIPELFRDAGFDTFNDGKEDYNFEWSGLYNLNKLSDVSSSTPFFGQIQLSGGKASVNSSRTNYFKPLVTIPPYYPNHNDFRTSIAKHYATIEKLDTKVNDILTQLTNQGLRDNTVVFIFSDHGFDGLRAKQFCYEEGLRVPFMVSWTGGGSIETKITALGTARNDMINMIDISKTSLALAGVTIPSYIQGKDFFSGTYTPRDYVIGARDRLDWTIDRIRTVRSANYRYIRNLLTDRPYLQSQYRETWNTYATWMAEYQKYSNGDPSTILTADSARFAAPDRPYEELYDMNTDPHQINNLAENPAYATILQEHHDQLDSWMVSSGDINRWPERDAGLLAVMTNQGYRNKIHLDQTPEYIPVICKNQELLSAECQSHKFGLKELAEFAEQWQKDNILN